MGGEGGVKDVGLAIASALTVEGICYFIFYNIMFSRLSRIESNGATEVGVFDFGDGDIHVDTVEERAGELLLVSVDLILGAGTFVSGVAKIAAGAGIHGSNKHEVGGVGGFSVDARDGNFFVFKRLAESF